MKNLFFWLAISWTWEWWWRYWEVCSPAAHCSPSHRVKCGEHIWNLLGADSQWNFNHTNQKKKIAEKVLVPSVRLSAVTSYLPCVSCWCSTEKRHAIVCQPPPSRLQRHERLFSSEHFLTGTQKDFHSPRWGLAGLWADWMFYHFNFLFGYCKYTLYVIIYLKGVETLEY